jgi:HlyD family secretion protein
MKRRILIAILAVAGIAAIIIYVLTRTPREIILTAIVTTDEVIVSSQIQGRLQQLLVRQGDTVESNQLVATIQPQEWKADMTFYSSSAEQSGSQVAQAQADLQYQADLTSNQIAQAQANVAAAQAQVAEGQADLDNATLIYKREEGLHNKGVDSTQVFEQARAVFEVDKARLESFAKQVLAAQAGVALAQANQQQVTARRATLEAMVHQEAAATAQKERAGVRLGYTEIRAPIKGIVDVRAALQGEVVSAGQAIVTLIDPDNLWIRADVEETYIDHIHLGDKMTVRLPSGAQRTGTVFYRGADADYATQRDVSRTKRDIKTFEIRLRCDNQDRSLAVGMTAYVPLVLR